MPGCGRITGLFIFYMASGIDTHVAATAAAVHCGFRLLVHAGDIVWPALISIFSEGSGTPFFLFFFFVLAAAAYRWGLWETLGTAAAEVALLWAESFVIHHARARPCRFPALGRLLNGVTGQYG